MKKETKKNDQNEHKPKGSFFETLAAKVTTATGSTPAILIAFGVVVVWAATGPLFHFSETWQLVINTGTTIVTFLMVFLIQKTQNKDSLAIQLKLDELVAVNNSANNMLVDVEDMTEEEMKVLQKYYQNFTGKPTKEMMNAGKTATKSTAKDADKTDKKQASKSK
jgi:low affinity Fe/Cu permease